MPVSLEGSPLPKPKQIKKKVAKVDPEDYPPMIMERPPTPTRSAGPTPEFDDLMLRLRFLSVSAAPWEYHHKNLEEAVENDDTVSTQASDYTPSIDDCRVFGKVAGDNGLEVLSPIVSPVASAFSSPAAEAKPKTTPIPSPLSSPAGDQSKKSSASSPSSPASASKAAGPSILPRLPQAFGSNVPFKIFVETESAKKRWSRLTTQSNNTTTTASIHPHPYPRTKPSTTQLTEATIASLSERRCFFTKAEEELLIKNLHLLDKVPGGFSLRAANMMKKD